MWAPVVILTNFILVRRGCSVIVTPRPIPIPSRPITVERNLLLLTCTCRQLRPYLWERTRLGPCLTPATALSVTPIPPRTLRPPQARNPSRPINRPAPRREIMFKVISNINNFLAANTYGPLASRRGPSGVGVRVIEEQTKIGEAATVGLQ